MKNPDMLWKIFTTALGVIVVPLAGWVWSVNVEVAQLRNDVGDLENQVVKLEEKIEKQEEASRTLIKVESDLGHVREILSRIEDLVTSS
jgi:cell division protein FtsL